MSRTEASLAVATQGGEYSFHALAARTIAGHDEVEIIEKRRFGEVVKASRSNFPGLGVIAISTVAGTVEDSAKEIVRKRPSALPPVVERVDIPVEISLMGSRPQTIEELNRRGVKCLAQKPAALQCEDFLHQNLPWIKVRWFGESTEAIKNVVNRDDPNFVALGPSFAAEPLGAVIIGPHQINPPHSETSFYVLQRDPRMTLLPVDPEKTTQRTVITLAHPEGEGELAKSFEFAEKLGVRIARVIPFAIGDYTRHNNGLRREGGIIELAHDQYDERVTEWCARVNGIAGNDEVEGPFSTKKLGGYPWYPEEPIDLQQLLE